MPLTISVVVPTRNRATTLRATLGCLRAQDLPESFEVVVVDDGSSPPVRVSEIWEGSVSRVVRREGVERSAARNAGAEVAQGEILVFLDDDVAVGREFLAAHLDAQKEWPGVLAVGRLELAHQETDGPFVRFRRSLERGEVPSRRGLVTQANFCTAANMSIRRDAFLALGGFPEEIVSGEDQDLALRHTAAGGRIAFLPEARGVHLDRALDISSYCRRVEWGSEHIVRFCQRHPTWPDNVERDRVNGPLRGIRRSVPEISKWLLKAALSRKEPVVLMLGLARLLSKVPSGPGLDTLYRVLIGLHLFRGYQRGLKRFGPVPSPPAPSVERA